MSPTARLRERWADAGHAMPGIDPDRVVDAALGRARPPAAPSMRQVAEHLLGPAG